METIKLYLSGGMSNLSYKDRTVWRNQIKNAIKYDVNSKTTVEAMFIAKCREAVHD